MYKYKIKYKKNYKSKIKQPLDPLFSSPTHQIPTQDPTSDKSHGGGGGPDPRSPPPPLDPRMWSQEESFVLVTVQTKLRHQGICTCLVCKHVVCRNACSLIFQKKKKIVLLVNHLVRI